MNPQTLANIRAELDDLTSQVEDHARETIDFWLTGKEQTAIRLRIRHLRAMLELTGGRDGGGPSVH